MLGRICVEKTKLWRVTAEEEDILGLRLLKVTVPPPYRQGKLRAAARLLVKARVGRVLAPAEFGSWDLLGRYGLSPVEVTEFCRAMAAPLVLAGLRRMELAEGESTVALRGDRVTRAMRLAALRLCPQVRSLVVSAPQGGEALRAELRREYGVPALEEHRSRPPDVAVHFSETGGDGGLVLRLHGRSPDLGGLEINCAREGLPEHCDRLPLLAALWETGKLRGEEPGAVTWKRLDRIEQNTYNTG